MKKYSLLILSFVLALSTALAHAQQRDDDDDDDDRPIVRPPALKPGEKPLDADFVCPYTPEYQHPQQFGKLTVRMSVNLKTANERCRAAVVSPRGSTPVAADWALTVDKISGTDINGDGKPELVIEGYNGGERCCFTYSFVTLSDPPRVLRKIETRGPLTFDKQADGKVIIRAEEKSFDYFIIPHFAAVIPTVFLQMKGDRLLDVGARFQEQYDQQIAEARSQLTAADLDKFRQSDYHKKMFTDQIPTAHRVLTIVLDYLYSGREDQAWQALDELWPASDRERVKELILERRQRGLVAQVNSADTQVTTAKKAQ